jgi:hypothetical protein
VPAAGFGNCHLWPQRDRSPSDGLQDFKRLMPRDVSILRLVERLSSNKIVFEIALPAIFCNLFLTFSQTVDFVL